jgi:TetR/AcrR family acrAB operon transcriptional repressor
LVRKTKAETERTRIGIIDAARRAFHEFGVSRTSLEKIARIAGVTRGAIYWHFKNKTELFHAMREQALNHTSQIKFDMLSEDVQNPLDAIERFLLELIEILKNDPSVRQIFEIMLWRCEYVGEFAPVLYEALRPRRDILSMLKIVYERAANRGFLRPALDPEVMAYDTMFFSTGLLNFTLSADRLLQAQESIRAHIALRRGDRRANDPSGG